MVNKNQGVCVIGFTKYSHIFLPPLNIKLINIMSPINNSDIYYHFLLSFLVTKIYSMK